MTNPEIPNDRIARVEAALRAACEKARAAGVALVTEAFEVDGGVCAWGAHNLYPKPTGVDLSAEEYDAIENGWDDAWEPWIRNEKIAPWFALGARLAAEFSPVPASSLEAA
jgi:hypothetical protein